MNYQWKVHHLIAEINKCFGIQASFLITYRAIQLVASLYAFIRYTFQKDLYPSTGAKLCSKFIWFTVRVNQLMVLVYPCECVLEEASIFINKLAGIFFPDSSFLISFFIII